ncbi:hypothetical protein KGS77_24630 [Streptomyces sp. MST-110588]|nr:hypothetical protein KGS77_24630 [Streptomyces sp. MST-110588]
MHEVVRRLPVDQRRDIADELRATIADTIEARGAAGVRSAEREVLSEMGDPIRCAARYADRPLGLIGPGNYPAYIRLLVLLLGSVLPVITVGSMLVELADGRDVGVAIGTGVTTVFTLGAQMFAGVTLVFAVAERIRHREGRPPRTATWTPDDLPEVRQPDKGGAWAMVATLWSALQLAAVVWQHTAQPYRLQHGAGAGGRIDVLDPALWNGWIWPVLAGLAARVAVCAVRVAGRGWTVRLAVCNAAAKAAFALPLAWILHHERLFNPEFLADMRGNLLTQDVRSGLAAIVLAVSAYSVVKAFRKARR